MQKRKSISGFFCQGTIDNLPFLLDPPLRACMKAVKDHIHGIAGACRPYKPCVTGQPYRILSFFCSQSVLCKGFYHLKGFLQCLWFFQPQLIDPVLPKPQKIWAMIDHSFRHCHQFSVKFACLQKFSPITVIHFFDPGRRAFFICLCQIFDQVVIYQLL